jgi:hypothetical protein
MRINLVTGTAFDSGPAFGFWGAVNRAEFYLWNALRGHSLPGNDPFTGRARSASGYHEWSAVSKAESLVAYKAMARAMLNLSRNLRETATAKPVLFGRLKDGSPVVRDAA